MTLTQIKNIIASWGLPYAYFEFEATGKTPAPPFVVYFLDGENDFKADNINYQKVRTIHIELYANNKKESMGWEVTLENSFDSNELSYSKENDYIPSERMYVTIYTTEVIYNEQQ